MFIFPMYMFSLYLLINFIENNDELIINNITKNYENPLEVLKPMKFNLK